MATTADRMCEDPRLAPGGDARRMTHPPGGGQPWSQRVTTLAGTRLDSGPPLDAHQRLITRLTLRRPLWRPRPHGRRGPAGDRYLQLVFAVAFYRFGQSTGCQRRNVAPWSSTHSAIRP